MIEEAGLGVTKTIEETGDGVAKTMEEAGTDEIGNGLADIAPPITTISVSTGAPGVVQTPVGKRVMRVTAAGIAEEKPKNDDATGVPAAGRVPLKNDGDGAGVPVAAKLPLKKDDEATGALNSDE